MSSKIPFQIATGKLKRMQLHSPKNNKIRPTQQILRQALINYLREFVEGAKVLDLFAGTGITGLELLSSGAYSVTFVDIAKQSIVLLEKNIEKCGFKKQTESIRQDAMEFLLKAYREKRSYDIIFMAPPYEKLYQMDLREQQEYIAELLDRAADLLSKQSVIVMQLPKKFKLIVPRKLVLLERRNYGINSLVYLIPKQHDQST